MTSSDPAATDRLNTARNSVTTSGAAFSVPATSGANSDNTTAPTEKNQLIPRIASHTPRPPCAARRIAQVLRNGLRSMRMSGAADGALGTASAARNPSTAKPNAATPASHGGMIPPSSCPVRIATNVPASTRPVPPISSWGCRCCGRIEYLTGPNTVECTPIRNRQVSSTGTDSNQNPPSASAMMAISAPFTARISHALFHASAICPAKPENRK